jgi:hypothetical protein
MKIRITSRAKKYLEAKNFKNIVLRFMELDVAETVGVVKDVTVSFEVPEDKDKYWCYNIDSYQVFVDRRLEAISDVIIKKQGFWKFASLYVDGFRISI